MEQPTDPTAWRKTAEELAQMPDAVEQLLHRHRPSAADINRCAECTAGGTGRPHLPWPCALRKLAELARDIAGGQ